MTEAKHTPGPWMPFQTTDKAWGVTSDGQTICYVTPSVRDLGKANARLIAAAPDMLEALQALAEGNSPFSQAAARAAIAKATGG